MSISSKLLTVGWFLRQPKLYPQLFYQIYQRVFPHPKENTGLEAIQWCQEYSVSTEQAINQLTGIDKIQSFEELFPEFILNARKRVENLPVKMGGGADLELLYYLTEYLNATCVIETGVALGYSSAALLLSITKRNGRLYSTDMPYAKMNSEDLVGCVVPDHLRTNWQLITLPDQQGVTKIEREVESIDLCHYDSDKSYRGRMLTYPRLWKMLRPNGIFISDDIGDNTAFMEFTNNVQVQPMVVYHKPEDKFIGILRKPE